LRTTFEINFTSSNIDEAREIATRKISKFLGISEKDFDNLVSLELKIATIEQVADEKLIQEVEEDLFTVFAYAALKSSITRF
jgi:hypothetical protein